MNYQLDHLNYAVPQNGFGNRLSSYLLALEAWRRGLDVVFYLDDSADRRNVLYQISDGIKKYEFRSSLGTLISEEANNICNDKHITKEYLARNNVRTPSWELFNQDQCEEAYRYAENIGFPLVVKPLSENAGKGVTAEIKSFTQLKQAIFHVTRELGNNQYIIEEHVFGDEYRLLLIDDQVVAATKRVPANIVGDGVSTVAELIKKKNRSKERNPNMSKKTIAIDEEVKHSLSAYGFSLNSIPRAEEQIFLRKKSNVSQGGDAIDVTSCLSAEMINLAESASAAIPGLTYCGLDMITPSNRSNVIIEINTKPMLGLHVFPSEGDAADVPAMIIDRYFPSSIPNRKSLFYFDFKKVIELLKKNIAAYLPVKSLNKLSYRSYYNVLYISGEEPEKTIKAVHNKVKELNLNGSLRSHNDRDLEVRIASSNEDSVEKFNVFINETKTIEQKYLNDTNVPVNLGYEYEGQKTKKDSKFKKVTKQREEKNEIIKIKNKELNKLEKDNGELLRHTDEMKHRIEDLEKNQKQINAELIKKNQKLHKQEQEIEDLKIKYNCVVSSISWKVTKPFRILKKV